eukprot:TRINITY_DN2309_c0_g1_i1.p1 TRINITY_DN2309_c0_g1~~TRINITY_DN2309_c0_g1_i1.p1  ORF type:complete len:179 (+),score=37.57 TRINITY_DN2309_c0_g1_i1:46-582(+)
MHKHPPVTDEEDWTEDSTNESQESDSEEVEEQEQRSASLPNSLIEKRIKKEFGQLGGRTGQAISNSFTPPTDTLTSSDTTDSESGSEVILAEVQNTTRALAQALIKEKENGSPRDGTVSEMLAQRRASLLAHQTVTQTASALRSNSDPPQNLRLAQTNLKIPRHKKHKKKKTKTKFHY